MRKLINELSKLPSIGEKSAARLASHLLSRGQDEGRKLSGAIDEACEKITLCSQCFALTENPLCDICSDVMRNPTLICVVEKPADVIAVEKSGGFTGRYHVLHGLWSPMRGVGPEQTKVPELISRIEFGTSSGVPISEIILATGTTVEGDATALYIKNAVAKLGLRVTRIAQGMPKGGELEYADEMTLNQAIEARRFDF